MTTDARPAAGPARAAARPPAPRRHPLTRLPDLLPGRRLSWRDGVVAAITLLGVASVLFTAGDDPVLLTSLQVVLALAAGTALWWRHRRPLPVVLLGCLSAALGGTALPVQAALFGLAGRHRGRRLLLASVAATAAVLVTVVVDWGSDPVGEDLPLLAGVVAFLVVLYVALPVAVGAFVGARRDLVRSLRERAEEAEGERRLRAEQERLAERTRIAQEMHDVLAHRISLVALHAGGLEVSTTAGPQDVERSAALIRTTARQALEDLRTVLGVLRSDATGGTDDGAHLLPQPTLADVERLVGASAEAGVAVALDVDLPPGCTPPPLESRTAYRVVQEGLTNVHKHAAGATAAVRLSGAPGAGLRVEVRNARPAAAAAAPLVPGAGLGLVGLRERVELAGGRLQVGEQPDGTFRVRADLPWPREREDGAA